jgi:ketosteroid isomerase-like protein
MRKLFIAVAVASAVAVGVLVGALAASGGSSASSASELQMRRNSDLWQIDQIEKTFHRATTLKDLRLMMSLYAPNATFTMPGTTAVGKREISAFWRTSKSFTNDWISETPAYKVRIALNGDRGTLYFECVYVDAKTGEVAVTTAADVDVARIGGRWLITSIGGASATLSP